MEVIFLRSFLKDIQKISDDNLKDEIKKAVFEMENFENIQDLTQIKKLKGHPFAYQKRIGNYRLGFYFENNKIELGRFVKRSDIYKLFS
ncbi:plasmid stabilization protein [Lacihabitans sp. LS3-19]|uniref:type II toxin-antitoxin system RelE family toxin n=1 Tax=Lacihabitans sp. LS3-19 TaxID=2487335 RepID=UPI0020CCA0DC|nr:hypothetical protein [Lacihabitans sp. LS3-19]MCP9766484.1 plasmid stabilization protein [Lacihabitans sp. LS3-19]